MSGLAPPSLNLLLRRFRQTCACRCRRPARGLVSRPWKLVYQILKETAQSIAHAMNRGTSHGYHQVNSRTGVELEGANRAAAGKFLHQRLGDAG